MDAKTRKALEGSIEKWQKIVAGTGIDEGARNCPLCAMFYNLGCHGCPVRECSGRPFCFDTPHDAYVNAIEYGTRSPEALRAAQAELDFLISLRPKKAKRRVQP